MGSDFCPHIRFYLTLAIGVAEMPADVDLSGRVEVTASQSLESPVTQIKMVLVTAGASVCHSSNDHITNSVVALSSAGVFNLDGPAAVRARRLVVLPEVGQRNDPGRITVDLTTGTCSSTLLVESGNSVMSYCYSFRSQEGANEKAFEEHDCHSVLNRAEQETG